MSWIKRRYRRVKLRRADGHFTSGVITAVNGDGTVNVKSGYGNRTANVPVVADRNRGLRLADITAISSGPTWRASSTATSTTGAFSVTAPTGTASGDVLVLVCVAFFDGKTGAFGALGSTGWTKRDSWVSVGLGNYVSVYTKVAGASETSYSWSGAAGWLGGVMAVVAISGASAFDAISPTLSSTTSAASLTTTATNDLLLYVSASASSSTPAGMTTQVNYTGSTTIDIDSQNLTASGATGVRTGSGSGYKFLLAVK